MRGHTCRFYTCHPMTESQTRNQNLLQYTHWRATRPQLFSAFIYQVKIEPHSQNCEIRHTVHQTEKTGRDRGEPRASTFSPLGLISCPTLTLFMQSTRRLAAAPAAAAAAAAAAVVVIARLRTDGRTEEKRDLEALRTDADGRRHEGSAWTERRRNWKRAVRIGPDSFHISGSHAAAAAAAEETMEHSLFSLSLSLSLCLRETETRVRVREFLLPAAVNSCVVSVSQASGRGRRGLAAGGCR